MSGGVDSSVAAALLKKAGFDVTGVFMNLLGSKEDDENRARAVAGQIGIPFEVVDLRAEFKKNIIERFITDTKKGLTPNPCVVCNLRIKFGFFLKIARAMGADYMATGHYAQIKKTKDGGFHLRKGKDKNKDQSYFLWQLGQHQLSKIIFPVGVFKKDEVRAIARDLGLLAADAAESQEVCFAAGNMEEFLNENCGHKAGNIVDNEGNILGQHQGLWFYTIGQRKGVRLPGGPFYVLLKNKRKNELVVERSLKAAAELINLKDVKWVSGVTPALPIGIKCRIRYRGKELGAVLNKGARGFQLKFFRPQIAPAPGQAAVFYRGQELLGGGVIV